MDLLHPASEHPSCAPSTTNVPTIDVPVPLTSNDDTATVPAKQNGHLEKDETIVTNGVNGTNPEH